MAKLLILLSSVCVSLSVAASVGRPSDEKLEKVLASILSQADDREKVMTFLASSNVPKASLDGIRADLEKKLPKPVALPVVKLENREIMIAGKPSGVTVTRLHPLRLSYKGKVWSYSEKDSPFANYQSVTQFLERTSKEKKSAAMLFLPSAEAFFSFDTMWNGIFSGGLLGVMGGALVGYMTGAQDWFKTSVMGGLIGAGLGGILGYQNETQVTPVSSPGGVN